MATEHPAHTPDDRLDEHELRARLTRTEDGATALTLSPAEVSAEKRTTTWLSADEDSYVDLDSHR